MPPKSLGECRAAADICARGAMIWEQTFRDKNPSPRPHAIVVMGVQGSGKSTKCGELARKHPSYVLINPDTTLINLVGRGQPLPDRRADAKEIFEYARRLTNNMIEEAIAAGYDLITDMAMPSESSLKALRDRGYDVRFVVMETSVQQARRREVRRDVSQLGWGRPGLSSASQRDTARSIRQNLGRLTQKYADSVVRCKNSAAVMRCSDGSRVVPDPRGPDTRVGMRPRPS